MKEKRKNSTLSDEELYEISNLNDFIEKEKRKDELARVNEIKQQKRLWSSVVFVAGFIIFVFLILAYIGWVQNV